MVIAFTICSYNYSALAIVLFHSLKEHNPDIKFFLALVDTPENYQLLREKIPQGMNLLMVDENVVSDYADLQKRYTIIELNTAIKPFVFDHLFSKNPTCNSILYFDPDILIYDSLQEHLLFLFDENDFILTPHIIQPRIEDKFAAAEIHFLNYGIYNLGFLGLKRSEAVFSFLQWWKLRLKYWCYANIYAGLFTDQVWINFVPLFYDKVLIFKHPGANVAHWNLLERKLLKINGKYFVNEEKYPLLFYHFSAFTHFTEEPSGEIPFSKLSMENGKMHEIANEIIVSYQKRLVQAGQKDFFGSKTSKKQFHFSPMNMLKNILLRRFRKRGLELTKTIDYYHHKKLI